MVSNTFNVTPVQRPTFSRQQGWSLTTGLLFFREGKRNFKEHRQEHTGQGSNPRRVHVILRSFNAYLIGQTSYHLHMMNWIKTSVGDYRILNSRNL